MSPMAIPPDHKSYGRLWRLATFHPFLRKSRQAAGNENFDQLLGGQIDMESLEQQAEGVLVDSTAALAVDAGEEKQSPTIPRLESVEPMEESQPVAAPAVAKKVGWARFFSLFFF